ncbi:hypothetical protein Tco_0040330 [Tanacetum coccineum]
MGGSSSQLRTNPPRSPINAFPIEELYTPEFSESLQENTAYWHQPNAYEAVEVALAKGWRPVYENSEHGNARKKGGFWCEVLVYIESKTKQEGRRTVWDASINLNTTVADEDEVQEIRRPGGRDKARAAAKNKGSKASGSSTINDDALPRLMVNGMTAAEMEQRDAFMELKRREVECREREIAATEYRAQQEDIKLYLSPYDHLTGEQRLAMDEIRAKIKPKYNLQY